jgi:hypothetical protein
MKKFVLGLSLVLALSMWTLAQTSESQSGTSSGSSGQMSGSSSGSSGQMSGSSGQMSGDQGTMGEHHKGHHKNAAGESVVKGCLNSSGGTATLTTAHGKTINVVPASGVDLAPHNGHEVKLTGTWEKSEAGSSAASTGGKSGSKTFNATKMEHISDTCTAGGGGKHKKGGSSGMGESPKS